MICHISGVLRFQNGELARGAVVYFQRVIPGIVRASVGALSEGGVYTETNAAGQVSADLVDGDYWMCHGPIRQLVTVPDAPTADLMSLISGGPPPPPPTITLTGSPTVSTFGTFTQIVWTGNGGMSVSGAVAGAQVALVGSGGGGGYSASLTAWPGGGGAGGLVVASGPLAAGDHMFTVPAGVAPVLVHDHGLRGLDAVWTIGGIEHRRALGGGYGGIAAGGSGGGGGGGGGSDATTAWPGGTGDYNGGSGYPSGSNAARRGGGGAGAGGDGGNGVSGASGEGGAGVTLTWTSPPLLVCEGGDGAVVGIGGGPMTPGSGTHGLRQYPAGAVTSQAGICVIVFPTANATVA